MDRQDMFRMHLGSEFAPGFFAWEIPCGDFTRVGLCTSWSAGPPAPYLKHLLSRLGYSDKVIGMSCGRIPVGRRRTMSSDRIMLVGDAASQIKPISGGGIYPSMMAAPLLAEVASPRTTSPRRGWGSTTVGSRPSSAGSSGAEPAYAGGSSGWTMTI